MKCISEKRCVIGEGPVWNSEEGLLYFTNGLQKENCTLDIKTGEITVFPTEIGVAAICFDKENNLIFCGVSGVFRLENGKLKPLFNMEEINIRGFNDAKVGPDGRLYVGTQCEKRRGISEKIDGGLYSICPDGEVKTLLCGLSLSNGLDWSMDEKRLYHTDSDTKIIKEYAFDKKEGSIEYTGRQVEVPGVDGFTIDKNDKIYAACWGKGHIAVIDTAKMKIESYMPVPTRVPASCAFCGENMDTLAVVTASIGDEADKLAGCTFIKKTGTSGRAPYRFGIQEEICKHP